MQIDELETIRELLVEGDPERRLLVRWSPPVWREEAGCFECRYSVGRGDAVIRGVFGEDRLQAIALTLKMIDSEIDLLGRGQVLTWSDGSRYHIDEA